MNVSKYVSEMRCFFYIIIRFEDIFVVCPGELINGKWFSTASQVYSRDQYYLLNIFIVQLLSIDCRFIVFPTNCLYARCDKFIEKWTNIHISNREVFIKLIWLGHRDRVANNRGFFKTSYECFNNILKTSSVHFGNFV